MQEAIDELGYSPNRAARNLRTRASHLIGLRFSPAQEGTANAAMDRFVHSLVETSGEAGYHVLLFAVGEAEDDLRGYDDLLRSTAVDAFVVTDTYLGNPQAAWLRRAPGAVRGVRPAVGRPEAADHPWVDVDGAAGADLATTHLLERGHQRIAWIGWRKDSRIGEDRRSGWTRAHARPRPLDHRPGLTGRGHRRVAAARPAPCSSTRRSPRRSSAPPTPSRWACCTPCATAACAPGHDIAVVGFDDSQVAQVVPPGLTSVRQPLEEVAVEVVTALEGLLGHPPIVSPGVLLTPTLVVRGSS